MFSNLMIQFKKGQYRIIQGQAMSLPCNYGELTGTRGADGDPLDVFQGDFPESREFFVLNQYKPDGRFDEHKLMIHFFDMEAAKTAYRIVHSHNPNKKFDLLRLTESQMNWWLQHGDHHKPITAQSLPFDSENYASSTSQFDWQNGAIAASQAIYNMRKTDFYEELLEAATMQDLMITELDNGAELNPALDALVVENKKAQKTAQILGTAFNRASNTLKVAENGIQISEPYKSNGTTTVAMIFEMTDGQTISILLHNPDTTPQKLSPDDVLISYKWLLNRKDITIVVAKENGKDLAIQTVAKRVMALLEKNTARFAQNNAKRKERLANIESMKNEIMQKRAYLEELTARFEQDEKPVQNPNENQENLVFGGLTSKEYNQSVSDHLGKLDWDKSISVNIHTGEKKRTGNNFYLYNENNELIFNVRLFTSLYDVTATAYQLFKAGSSTEPVLTVNVMGNTPQMVAEVLNNEALKQMSQKTTENKIMSVELFKTPLGDGETKYFYDFDDLQAYFLEHSAEALENEIVANLAFTLAKGKELITDVAFGKESDEFDPNKQYIVDYLKNKGGHFPKDVQAAGVDLAQFSGGLNSENNVKLNLPMQKVFAKRYAHTFDDVREIANEFKNVPITNESTGMVASISGKAIDKMLSGKAVGKSSNSKAHLMAVANVDYLFEKAVTREIHKDRDNDPNIKNMHRMFAQLHEQDGESLVKLTIKEFENNQGNRIYSVEAIEIENSTVPDIADADTQKEPTSAGHHGAVENNDTTRQQAIQYLNDIINGEIDGMADGVLDRLFELIEPFENDDEINELAERASAIIEKAMPKNIE